MAPLPVAEFAMPPQSESTQDASKPNDGRRRTVPSPGPRATATPPSVATPSDPVRVADLHGEPANRVPEPPVVSSAVLPMGDGPVDPDGLGAIAVSPLQLELPDLPTGEPLVQGVTPAVSLAFDDGGA